MCFAIFSDVTKCCYCVTDLKTAAVIISLLALVTSPAISWAVTRHSYVVRVSCYMTTHSNKANVVDINFNNIVTFGLGANADLIWSCLQPTNDSNQVKNKIINNFINNYESTVKWSGWIVLCADLLFVLCSLNLLIYLSKGSSKKENSKTNLVAKLFICTGSLEVFTSFVFSMLYLFMFTCASNRDKFPVFELFFTCVDMIVWTYFLMVVNSYRRKVVLAYEASPKVSIQSTTFAATHEIAMVITPACPTQYQVGSMGKVMKAYRWLIFTFNVAVLVGGFVFLIGMFKNKGITGVIFVICGLVVAIFSLFFGILGFFTKCKPWNDSIWFMIYAVLWCYFLMIINTYNQSVEDSKSVALVVPL